jgi:hypothetical protein
MMATFSPAETRLRHFGRRCVSRDHGFRLIVIAGGRREHEIAIADRNH